MNITKRYTQNGLNYEIRNGCIYKANGEYYYNRPLYLQNRPAVAIGGDKISAKFIYERHFLGKCFFGIRQNENFYWLHLHDQETFFLPNHTKWKAVIDNNLIEIEMLPLSNLDGVAFSAASRQEIEFFVLHGFLNNTGEQVFFDNPMWKNDPLAFPDNILNFYSHEECQKNYFDGEYIFDKTGRNKLSYQFSSSVESFSVDAETVLKDSVPKEKKDGNCVCYKLKLKKKSFFAVQFLCKQELNLKREFKKAKLAISNLQKRVKLKTPDRIFNATHKFSLTALEGSYYDSTFVHGAMAWNRPYLGWHNMVGGTVYGRIDYIKKIAKKYLPYIETNSNNLCGSANKATNFCTQDDNSIFFGNGKIKKDDDNLYNFQSMFVDQLIHAWRYSGDEELKEILKIMLPLHIEWQKNCFDPQNSGLYESYINTWPTDSIWYNGGKGCEETAFAYNANLAMFELTGEKRFAKQAEKIKTAFDKCLWQKNEGHAAFYIDVLGEKRVHNDAWLWSTLLPSETNLTDEIQNLQALYYTEYALEHIENESGLHVYSSNLVPYIWSVRTLNQAEDISLANAYFKAGLSDEGWQFFISAIREMQLNQSCPGAFGNSTTGCDFTDVSSIYCQTLVEGLFGVSINNSRQKVRICPSFPSDWKNAELKTCDFSFEFFDKNNELTLNFSLSKKANAKFVIPIKNRKVSKLSVNGKGHDFTVERSVRQNRLIFEIENCVNVEINIKLIGNAVVYDDKHYKLKIGQRIKNVFKAEKHGHFLVLTNYRDCYIQHKIDVEKEMTPKLDFIPANAIFVTKDISKALNADITKIFEQEYLSPRVDTCSVQIDKHAFGGWTAAYWGIKPPKMNLCYTEKNMADGKFFTPQGIPFSKIEKNKNISFVSLYDNHKKEQNFEINDSGKALWILFAGATNVMQCNIENAKIIVKYCDGDFEIVDVIPPQNFWTVSPFVSPQTGSYQHLNHQKPLLDSAKFVVPLGEFCQANLLSVKLKNKKVKLVDLKCLSNEVIIGIMGITLMK